MKRKILSTLVLVSLFLSCDDRLDITPFNTIDSQNAIRTSADVEALLTGAYATLGDGDLYGGNILRDSELLGDDGEIFWGGTFVAPGEIWDKAMLITNDQARETWLESYRTIDIANTVLANLPLVTDDRRSRVEGEARFIRGTIYFELVRTYARTWTDGDPSVNPGVPLKLEPTNLANATTPLTRSSVAQVYSQVIDDLQTAENLLPSKNAYFATTYTASAMLSRVFLMQNNYTEALAKANRVISVGASTGSYSLVPAFGDVFARNATRLANRGSNTNATSEDIFAIQVTEQAGVNNMNTFFDANGRGDIDVESFHLSLYEAADVRRAFFIISGGLRYTRKFTNRFGNVTIIRLAEMYLTRAECNQRLTSSVGDTPLNDINRIRNRAGLANAVSVDLDEILLERRRELAFEGHQLHDLKRTQRSVGALPFDSPNLIFPIPQRETILNPNLTQNEGYQ